MIIIIDREMLKLYVLFGGFFLKKKASHEHLRTGQSCVRAGLHLIGDKDRSAQSNTLE